jgi:two-component system response regulator AtoC
VPPLRERKESIPELLGGLLFRLREKVKREEIEGITDEAFDALARYKWPGNVRELGNVVERAMVLSTGKEITLADLPPEIGGLGDLELTEEDRPRIAGDALRDSWLDHPLSDVRKEVLARFERAYLAGMLRKSGGRVGDAAAAAGISARALYDKMKAYGLRKEDFKSAP